MKTNAAHSRAMVLILLRFAVLMIAALSQLAPAGAQETSAPNITTAPKSQAAFIGHGISFSVAASSTLPMSYQWRLDGQPVPDQTNRVLHIQSAQPIDEGDYTVTVSNSQGSITSRPKARLFVVPADAYLKGNFTNSAGLRLPYYYRLPTGYDPSRKYPLICYFHGVPGDENIVPGGYFPTYAAYHVFSSFRQQAVDPAIVVWPCRRAGDTSWTPQYLKQAADLMDDLMTRFSIDANRVYVSGGSEGVHAAWDLIGLKPGFFAAARLSAGGQGTAPASVVKDVPIWATCSQSDGDLQDTRALVHSLQQWEGNPLYTEYASGAHLDTIAQAWCTPIMMNWLLGQRRNSSSSNEPLLTIDKLGASDVLRTATAKIELTGSASAADEPIESVTWQNYSSGISGEATGTNNWSAKIPLRPDQTNALGIVATTSSWAPGFGGTTTFSASIAVYSSPIQLALRLQSPGTILSWTGGWPPYELQFAEDLASGTWQTIATNASPPLSIGQLGGRTGFYRVLGP